MLRCDTIVIAMMFKTFRDLAKSSLADLDAAPEKILLELAVKSGIQELKLKDLEKILTLIHEAYHSQEDIGITLAEEDPLKLQVPLKFNRSNRFWQLTKPSDAILKNIFKLMLETDVWDKLVFSDELERHVLHLKGDASRKIIVSGVFAESWREHVDHKMEDLYEIWSELLEKIAEKKSRRQREEPCP